MISPSEPFILEKVLLDLELGTVDRAMAHARSSLIYFKGWLYTSAFCRQYLS